MAVVLFNEQSCRLVGFSDIRYLWRLSEVTSISLQFSTARLSPSWGEGKSKAEPDERKKLCTILKWSRCSVADQMWNEEFFRSISSVAVGNA
jgi:hypothetical protein